MSAQEPPSPPGQNPPQLRAVPKRRGRPPKIPPPQPVEPIPGPDGTHARLDRDEDLRAIVTWVPATVKPGYGVGHRYATDGAGQHVIIGTYERRSTVDLPDGTTAVIPVSRVMVEHAALLLDFGFESATYDHDKHLVHPDGTPALGQAHHDRVAAYRARHDHVSEDAAGYVLCRCSCPICLDPAGGCICPQCANHRAPTEIRSY